MKKKKNIFLLLAALLATFYVFGVISYFGNEAETTAGSIALLMVLPNIIMSLLGVIFGWIAFFTSRHAYALVSVIFYLIALIVFIMYGAFLVPSIVLGFIGYEKQKRINKQ